MIPGQLKQLVQLAGVFGLLAGVIGISYLANWWIDRMFPTRSFTQYVCQGAYRSVIRYETGTTYVDVPLTDGCFSGTVFLPAQWKTWKLQFEGASDPSHWVSVWYGGMQAPAGPFRESQVNAGMTGGPSREMRFQGRGILRLSRLTEDPEFTARQLIAQAEQQDESSSPGLIDPISVTDSEYTMQLARCGRQGNGIECLGYVTNKTHSPVRVALRDGVVRDDLGRSFSIGQDEGAIRFGAGSGEELSTGMRARFTVRIPDPDAKISRLHLDLSLRVPGKIQISHFIFSDVRVQPLNRNAQVH